MTERPEDVIDVTLRVAAALESGKLLWFRDGGELRVYNRALSASEIQALYALSAP